MIFKILKSEFKAYSFTATALLIKPLEPVHHDDILYKCKANPEIEIIDYFKQIDWMRDSGPGEFCDLALIIVHENWLLLVDEVAMCIKERLIINF